ncbi:MAG: hypothetical protein ABIG71_04780 [Candidatus Uhrbacteria bacterium]
METNENESKRGSGRTIDRDALTAKTGVNVFGYRNPHAHFMDELCPKCGQGDVVCCYCDMGFTDYYDEFWHVCMNPNCDHLLHSGSYTGTGCESDSDLVCPFCRFNHISGHPYEPK